jgi:hypothetical protein
MSEKLKALINSVFIQLNRYEKQQPDFSAEVFLRECESYFAELDRLIFQAGSAYGGCASNCVSTPFRVGRKPLTLFVISYALFLVC